jgi:hypothetical protein
MDINNENDVRDQLQKRYDHYTAVERFDFVKKGSNEVGVEDTENDKIYKVGSSNKNELWNEVYNFIVHDILA